MATSRDVNLVLGRRWLHQTSSAGAQRVSFVLLALLVSPKVFDPNAGQMVRDGVELLDDTPDGRHRRLFRRSRRALWFSIHIVENIRYNHLEDATTNSWCVAEPFFHAAHPYSYGECLQRSRAEFSVAKNGYVKANRGWISDWTVCYLASGKPALVQSTGFEAYLPTGKGLLAFRALEEAVSG